MQITTRPTVIKDAEEVMLLTLQLGYNLTINEITANIQQVLASQNHLLLVAINNLKVIGWIHAFKAVYLESKPFIEIGGLVVDENYRGKGVGKMLINEVKQWCILQEIFNLRLRTNIKRNEAHEFYRSLGFEEVKRQIVFAMQINKEAKEKAIV